VIIRFRVTSRVLDMQISRSFVGSWTLKILRWLFVDSDKDLFRGSRILSFLHKLTNRKLSLIFFALSFIYLWYESLFIGLGIGVNLGPVLLVLAFLFCDKSRVQSTRATMYLVLLVLALLFSGLLAAINGIELGMMLNGVLLFSQFVLAFIVASTYKNKMSFINMILLLSLPVILVGIYQGLWGPETSRLWVSGAESLIDARAFGFFGSPNILGSLAMVTVTASLFAFLGRRKWYYVGYTALAVVALVLTFSRSAWVGAGIGIALALVIKNWRLILLAPLGLFGLLIPNIRQRLMTAISPEYMVDASLDGRVWSFNNAVEIFKTSPVLGTGPGTYGGETAIYYNSPVYLQGMQNGYIALPYTDNQWLQVLVQAGLIGVLMVGGFFISLFVNNLRQFRRSRQYLNLGILAAIVAVVINGFFANIWEFSAISVLSGAYLGLGNSYEK